MEKPEPKSAVQRKPREDWLAFSLAPFVAYSIMVNPAASPLAA
jgi:hypothetical protein